MNFNAHNLSELTRGAPEVVGYITITKPRVEREFYECAAWFRDHQLQPGRYPVMAARTIGIGPRNGQFHLTARVPTRVVAACLVSLFGGVGYGPDEAGQREVGKELDYCLAVGHGTHHRKCLNPDARSFYEAGEGHGELFNCSGVLSEIDGVEFEWLPEFQPKPLAG